MKIGEILKDKQPDVYRKLHSKRDNKEREQFSKQDKKQEYLSFCDIQNLMKHDSYSRHKGALRQKSWGK